MAQTDARGRMIEINASDPKALNLDRAIRKHVERVLACCDTTVEAARALGIGKTTLYRYLKAWKAEDR